MREKFDVRIEEDESVTITDIHGEIVMWNKDEIEEEPTLVALAIANAVKTVYEEGPARLREIISHPGMLTGTDYRKVGDKVKTLNDLWSVDVFGCEGYYADHPEKNKMRVAAGVEGHIDYLGIGWFSATFPLSGDEEGVYVTVKYDWGDESERFVFTDKNVGYGDEVNAPEGEMI